MAINGGFSACHVLLPEGNGNDWHEAPEIRCIGAKDLVIPGTAGLGQDFSRIWLSCF